MSEIQNQGSEKMDKNLNEMALTVKEAGKHIDESPHVIRNWLRELKSHIHTNKGENGYHYFNKEAIERLLFIKKLIREQGYSLKQVDYYLSTGEDPLQPEFKPDNNNQILKELEDLKEQFKKQEQFNQVLLERLENQNTYIHESLNKRDQQLMQTMIEMQQAKIEASATEEKKGFWSRLFSRNK